MAEILHRRPLFFFTHPALSGPFPPGDGGGKGAPVLAGVGWVVGSRTENSPDESRQSSSQSDSLHSNLDRSPRVDPKFGLDHSHAVFEVVVVSEQP